MKAKWIVIAIVNMLALLFFGAMTLFFLKLKGSLPDQQTVSRWSDGSMPYAQVSIYFEPSAAMTIDTVFMTRTNMEKKLVENSLSPEKEGTRLWADAFSTAQEKITVSTETASADTSMFAVGGDFFLFHPQELLYGSYFSDNDVMQDRVVIDDVLAWRLYGSSDIAGKPVIINGKYFFIAGVFRQSDNSDVKKVYGEKPRIFMSYQGYELLGKTPRYECYEACLPSPVKGAGARMIKEALSASDDTCLAVENSSRYSLKNRFGIIKNFGMRSVVDKAVVYPYWENAARITEDKSALLLVLQIIGLAVPVSTVTYLIAKLIRGRKKLIKKAIDAIKRKYNDFKKGRRERPKEKKKKQTSAAV
ncbi:MAG: ABC transporter permease [Oscillospiraceae bacterium]|nr:ABC transporter permease [Oscillospiraceae bacterium]